MIIIASYSNVSVTYTADGTQTVFSFPFDYLRKAFVYVEADGNALEQGTDFSVYEKTVVFTEAPAEGTTLRIFRETETIPLVSWADASVLKAKDMTIQQVQVLHILEEYKGQYNEDLANMLIIAGVVTDSGELQHIVDQLNLIDANAAAALESKNSAIASATAATTAEAALVNFLATKETITAPAVDTTLTVSGAAADAKATGLLCKSLVRYEIDSSLLEVGSLNINTGATSATSIRMRTKNFLPKTIAGFKVNAGYQYIIFAYQENGTYVGVWNGTTFEKAAHYFTDVNVSVLFNAINPNYFYKLIIKRNDNGAIDLSVDADEITFIYATDTTLTKAGTPADSQAVGAELSLFSVKELLWANTSPASKTQNGITFTVDNTSKSINISGTATGSSILNFYYNNSSFPSWLEKDKTYYAHCYSDKDVEFQVQEYVPDEELSQMVAKVTNGVVAFNFSADAVGALIRLYIPSGTETNVTINPFLSENKTLKEIESEFDRYELAGSVFELYTEFEQESGWWKSTGKLTSDASFKHNKPVRIRPNTQYYTGYKISGNTCYGAFFDKNGAWIAPLLNSDYTEYIYQTPNADPSSTLTNYVKLYTFTSPANAYFFSYNMTVGNQTYAYRNYVASKPLFALTNTGNYVIGINDPLYQRYKDKKLCVIGASGVMIDRLFRDGSNDDFNQYVVGWQEYLYPYFDTVDSYGYSSASWRKYDVEDGASARSIYSRIVTDQLDLSGYDVFILGASGNALTASTIGSVSSPSDLGDVGTYVGAMRQVIDYIYSQNPYAEIYVTNLTSTGDNTTRMTCNDEVKNMTHLVSCPYIDLFQDTCINAYNRTLYSYDGGNHMNQLGNQLVGLVHRKAIIGI